MALPDDNKQVRQFARAVTAGELTRDAYRRQRSELIDRHAGEAPTSVGGQFAANTATMPDLPVVPDLAAVGVTTVAEGLPADAGSHGRRDLLIGILVAMAVVLGAAGLVLLMFFR